MEKEVYAIIDDLLNRCNDKEQGFFGVPFNRTSTNGSDAIALMKKYELVDFHTDDIASIKQITIKINGVNVINAGGFEKWVGEKNLKESIKENLELEKLKLDIKKVKRDYNWGFWLSILAIIISLASIIVELKRSKQ